MIVAAAFERLAVTLMMLRRLRLLLRRRRYGRLLLRIRYGRLLNRVVLPGW